MGNTGRKKHSYKLRARLIAVLPKPANSRVGRSQERTTDDIRNSIDRTRTSVDIFHRDESTTGAEGTKSVLDISAVPRNGNRCPHTEYLTLIGNTDDS